MLRIKSFVDFCIVTVHLLNSLLALFETVAWCVVLEISAFIIGSEVLLVAVDHFVEPAFLHGLVKLKVVVFTVWLIFLVLLVIVLAMTLIGVKVLITVVI